MQMSWMFTAAAVALAATPALAASGKLVLYTSQPNADAQATVDAFMAAYPEVEVEWFRDGTTKVMAKLRAEFAAEAPQPDVLLIADMVTMEGLEAEGRLMAYPEADVSAYDPAIMDTEGHYFSTKLITTGIVYNTGAPPWCRPSYKDLLKPEAEGKLAMPSPLTSGAATIHMAATDGASRPRLGLLRRPRRAGRQTRKAATVAPTRRSPAARSSTASSSTSCRSATSWRARRSSSSSPKRA